MSLRLERVQKLDEIPQAHITEIDVHFDYTVRSDVSALVEVSPRAPL